VNQKIKKKSKKIFVGTCLGYMYFEGVAGQRGIFFKGGAE